MQQQLTGVGQSCLAALPAVDCCNFWAPDEDDAFLSILESADLALGDEEDLPLLPSLNPSGPSLAVLQHLVPPPADPPLPAPSSASFDSEGTPLQAPASPASLGGGIASPQGAAPAHQQQPILLAKHAVSRGPAKRSRSGNSSKQMTAQLPAGPSPPQAQGSSASLPALVRTVTTTLSPAAAAAAGADSSASPKAATGPPAGPTLRLEHAIAAIASSFEVAFASAAVQPPQQQQQVPQASAGSKPAVPRSGAAEAPASCWRPPASDDFDYNCDMDGAEEDDGDSDFEGSNLTDDEDVPASKKPNKSASKAAVAAHAGGGGGAVQGGDKGPGKRKAPEVDWRSIEDPAERRRQRRLAKNRVTAARSRERKKSQWAVLEARLAEMEAEGRALREMLEAVTHENASLRAQLATAAATAAAGHSSTSHSGAQPPQQHQPAVGAAAAAAAGKGGHGEPAALVLIAIMLLFVTSLPASSSGSLPPSEVLQRLVLGGTLTPALLLLLFAGLLSTSGSLQTWSNEHAPARQSRCPSPDEASVGDAASQQSAPKQKRGTNRRRQQKPVAPSMASGNMAVLAAAMLQKQPPPWPGGSGEWLAGALWLAALVSCVAGRGRGLQGGVAGRRSALPASRALRAHLVDWRRAAPMGLTCGL